MDIYNNEVEAVEKSRNLRGIFENQEIEKLVEDNLNKKVIKYAW